MKEQLLIKLSCFIVATLILSAGANAQIIYTDLNPDKIVEKGRYYLDLNNDGTLDDSITIFVSRPSIGQCRFSKVSIFATKGNAVASSTYPLAMNLNDTISSRLSWSASGDLRFMQSGDSTSCPNDVVGFWTSEADHFLGLRLNVGTDTYYGWLRMQITGKSLSTLGIIKDYAYNSIPNQAILAGQTSTTGITESIVAASIALYPNPATNHLTIALPITNKKVAITITDITGKIIYAITVSETQRIEVNTKDFAEGVYLVQVQSEDYISTKKLFVKK